MHYPKNENPIHLVHHDDGIKFTFKSYDHVVENWPALRTYHIGSQFKIDWEPDEWIREYCRLRRHDQWPARYYLYVLRDSFGDLIDPEKIRDDHQQRHPYRSTWWYFPGGKRNWRHGYFRRIRTFQERKWAHAWDDEDDAPKCRAARQGHNLPDPWDDIPHFDQDDRSWKRYRKHQWKVKRQP